MGWILAALMGGALIGIFAGDDRAGLVAWTLAWAAALALMDNVVKVRRTRAGDLRVPGRSWWSPAVFYVLCVGTAVMIARWLR
ncbi:MAG: hypothetical protein HY216_12255 [Candidatus Rokubacteria bacterium]|nr:hypothetical protein [Candidatus Rokubacteria bacterium]